MSFFHKPRLIVLWREIRSRYFTEMQAHKFLTTEHPNLLNKRAHAHTHIHTSAGMIKLHQSPPTFISQSITSYLISITLMEDTWYLLDSRTLHISEQTHWTNRKPRAMTGNLQISLLTGNTDNSKGHLQPNPIATWHRATGE